jgi:predicted HAD superfamily Cof-like phosphohydrolase
MTEQLEKVKDFHEKFRQEYSTSPILLTEEESKLRFKLAAEELQEYKDAVLDSDKIEILDSLADQLYILLGTVLKHGMQDMIIPAFNLVHENNMNKLDSNGEPILREDGKILKPKGFVAVKLETLFKQN